MTQINELRFFNECKKQVETKLNWIDSDNWKQRDFEYLIELIFDKSKIKLSLSTLKRIWAKDFEGSPQLNTLNALSVFLGYKDWSDFKISNDSSIPDQQFENLSTVKKESPKIRAKQKKAKYGRIIVLLSILLIIIIFLTLLRNYKFNFINRTDSIDTSLVKFSSKTTVLNGAPNSVIFNYDISKIDFDSAFIQQSWDKRRRFKIKKEDNFYSSIYYFPGFHRAKLIINDQIVKEHNIHITTDGWMCLVQKDFENPVPIYIPSGDLTINNQIYVSKNILKANSIDTKNTDYYVSYHNIKDFGDITADNFTFETQIKNSTDEGGLICQSCYIILICEYGWMNIPITTPGCVSNISLTVSDYRLSSQTNDMSAFGCDLNKWQKIKFKCINKNLNINIEDKEVYTLSYNDELGKLKGLMYLFHGTGAIQYVKILDKEDNISFIEEFKL